MATRTPLLVNLSAPDGPLAATRGLAGWLARTAPASARGEVTVAVVGDRRMQALNRMFRGHDAVTDVLSFPAGGGVADPPRGRAIRQLGDIVIARGVAARQARDHGHPVGTELRVLALHGLLHLLGYDHEVDSGRMARVESRLRRKGGLPGGLLDRSGRRPSRPGRRS